MTTFVTVWIILLVFSVLIALSLVYTFLWRKYSNLTANLLYLKYRMELRLYMVEKRQSEHQDTFINLKSNNIDSEFIEKLILVNKNKIFILNHLIYNLEKQIEKYTLYFNSFINYAEIYKLAYHDELYVSPSTYRLKLCSMVFPHSTRLKEEQIYQYLGLEIPTDDTSN